MLEKTNEWMLKAYVSKSEALRERFLKPVKNERGAGATEYALVISVVVALVIVAAYALRGPLEGFFQEIGTWLKNWLGTAPTRSAP